jgi:hypothetical protein
MKGLEPSTFAGAQYRRAGDPGAPPSDGDARAVLCRFPQPDPAGH